MMTSTDTTKDATEIQSIILRWAEAVRARDIGGVLAHHSDDILMFDVPAPTTQRKGIQAYEESWEQLFAWFGTDDGTFEVGDVIVHAGNDVAFATALIGCSGAEANGSKVELQVRLTVGLRKRGGAWTVVHEHHSIPAP
jgi:uncharacterized protein (TIGR02246 family)